MDFKNIFKNISVSIKWLLTRMLSLYVVFILLFLSVVNRDQLNFSTLNHIRPSFHYLALFSENDQNADVRELRSYIRYFEKVIKITPDYVSAYNFLGYCYYYAGEKKKAIETYLKGIQLNPDILWFYYNLGIIYYQQKDYAKAQEFFMKASRVHLEGHYEFVADSKEYRLFLRNKNMRDVDIGEKLIQRFSQSYLMMILCAQELGNDAQLFQLAQKAINPNFIYQDVFHYYAGIGALKNGNMPLAVVQFKKAVDINPEFKEANYFLGKGLESLGNQKEARFYLKRGKALENNSPSPFQLLLEETKKLKIY